MGENFTRKFPELRYIAGNFVHLTNFQRFAVVNNLPIFYNDMCKRTYTALEIAKLKTII